MLSTDGYTPPVLAYIKRLRCFVRKAADDRYASGVVAAE
jgi:hypothetical protein